ncbi:hypothetical protein CR105_17060 [Massilia eurypsychrophila]|jgi:uncharacterized protein (DUF2249 family)|uniref:DUF2249 domain-containing protein n=1 Tax=Massilia eurypsychrophila TaxID=1485217 RepID=A0A2G8TD05_9BURK|nr:DUF2249 domain-containing protein [Massilia eurypsychrophila]PIL43849.1 hypothetical protein CR105_17060 [Massilia eurypsychrophila]
MPQPINPPEVFLDLRGLYPPEPMERVLDALAGLLAGQQIRMLIEREPHPLFRILETNNYRYSSTEPEPGLYQIVIQER